MLAIVFVSTWVEKTNRQFIEVAQATSAMGLLKSTSHECIMKDSRSGTDYSGACGILPLSAENDIYTVKSLILAQDER